MHCLKGKGTINNVKQQLPICFPIDFYARVTIKHYDYHDINGRVEWGWDNGFKKNR